MRKKEQVILLEEGATLRGLLEELGRSLSFNSNSPKSANLKAALLRKLGDHLFAGKDLGTDPLRVGHAAQEGDPLPVPAHPLEAEGHA